jgi:hypothetical protein
MITLTAAEVRAACEMIAAQLCVLRDLGHDVLVLDVAGPVAIVSIDDGEPVLFDPLEISRRASTMLQ